MIRQETEWRWVSSTFEEVFNGHDPMINPGYWFGDESVPRELITEQRGAWHESEGYQKSYWTDKQTERLMKRWRKWKDEKNKLEAIN